jgi:hypothetical protein
MRTLSRQSSTKETAQEKFFRGKIWGGTGRSHFISPFSTGEPLLQRQCACGGGCPRCREQGLLQTKLKISEPNDPYEQEADRVADEVMRMPEPTIQRQMEPEENVEEMVQTKAIANSITPLQRSSTDSSQSAEVPGIVHDVLQRPGQPLDPAIRTVMEPHFGTDFSQVRVHSGTLAEQSARAVNANAYTAGHNIVFGSGQFAPGTNVGKRLIAHELTHVVQQSSASSMNGGGNRTNGLSPIHQPSAGWLATIQRDEAGGGSTEFHDRVTMKSQNTNSPIIEGTVTRTETAPASGSKPQEVISSRKMHVTFDPSNCSITIPFGYNFVQAAQALSTTTCEDPPSTTAVPLLSTDAFNNIKASFLADVNRGLNGWFDIKLLGKCPSGCVDRALPIRVSATEDTASPNTITVVNRGGRADSATICAASWNRSTAVHEGGHQVLGVGDEYPERDESLRATHPQWFRPERVRHDYSAMGPEEHTRFAMFHERHFNAVKIFLEDALPGCTATLQAHSRSIIPDYRVVLGGGYASLSGTSGFFFGAGLRVGIPFDRLRRWEVVLGPQINLMQAYDDQGSQDAFLLGARLGLEGSSGGVGHGFTAGVFGEVGHGWFKSTDYKDGIGRPRSATAAYGELGLGAGYRTPIISDSSRFDFRLEGAAGTTIGAPGIIGPITREIERDPERSRWFRLGLSVGAQF